MQVPKITEQQWINAECSMSMSPWQIANKAIEIALAEQQPWLNWRGGECPVPEGVMVEVTYRSGATDKGEGIGQAWGLYNNAGDIIEYRITGIAKGWKL